jgi:hypothetical protein
VECDLCTKWLPKSMLSQAGADPLVVASVSVTLGMAKTAALRSGGVTLCSYVPHTLLEPNVTGILAQV